MTVFMFQVKGDNSTLQQGFRMIESAFEKISPGLASRTAVLPSRTLNKNAEPDIESFEELHDSDLESMEENVSADAQSLPQEKAKRVKKPSKIPEVLKDFDPNGSTPSLKDYVSSKPISSTQKKYLAICAFFHEARQIKAIGVQHIFTCFKLLNWPVPNDLEKPFSNLAQTKKLDREGNGLFAINLLGLNDVSKQGD
jgi:hypothetical protein